MTATQTAAASITIACETCGQAHQADYSHEGRFDQGAIYAAVCTTDGLTDYYTADADTSWMSR